MCRVSSKTVPDGIDLAFILIAELLPVTLLLTGPMLAVLLDVPK